MHYTLMKQRNIVDADRPRSAPRHKVFIPTEIILSTGEMRAHLINVSLSGALAHAVPAPACDELIQVAMCGTQVAARVRWVDGPRFGLSFALPLSPALLKQVLGDG